MSEHQSEQHHFTRAQIDLPVEIHQGGSVWKQRLIDISVAGLATDQPDVWDAQYNEPFSVVINAGDLGTLELHAYLQDVEDGHLGFALQHLDGTNVELLRELLCAHVEDPMVIDADIERLSQS